MGENFAFLVIFDTCDVVYNWYISLLPPIVLNNLFECTYHSALRGHIGARGKNGIVVFLIPSILELFICSNWLTNIWGGHFCIIVKSLSFHSPLDVLFPPRRFISLSEILFLLRRFISRSTVQRERSGCSQGWNAPRVLPRILELLSGFWSKMWKFINQQTQKKIDVKFRAFYMARTILKILKLLRYLRKTVFLSSSSLSSFLGVFWNKYTFLLSIACCKIW